jgi:hypothetical protein
VLLVTCFGWALGLFAPAAFAAEGSSAAEPAIREINVRDYGAVGDGETDDTEAIQRASKAVHEHSKQRHWGSGPNQYARPVMVFPVGVYLVSDTVTVPGYESEIRGDGRAIIVQTDPNKDIFTTDWAWRMTVKNLAFFGGRRQIALTNQNIDTGMIRIENCRFEESNDLAVSITTISAMAMIEDCHFLNCEQAIESTTDMVAIRDCWLMNRREMTDKAQMELAGMAVVENLCLVPMTGGLNQRWIDNHGTLTCRDIRGGAEGGGITLIYNFARRSEGMVGPRVVVRDSYVAANSNQKTNCTVYCVEVPNQIVVEDCALQGGWPVIVDSSVDLSTYFTGCDPRALRFAVRNNMGLRGEKLPEGLKNPVCPEGEKIGISDEKASRLLDAAEEILGERSAKDSTGGSVEGHEQKTDPDAYVSLLPQAGVRWSLEDFMDATDQPGSLFLDLRPAGTDVILLRRVPAEGNWPHVLVGPVEVDLDETPWISFRVKEITPEEASRPMYPGFAVRVRDVETGNEVLLGGHQFNPNHRYHAFNVREALGVSGRREIEVKFYYLGVKYTKRQDLRDDVGDFLVLDFLRMEKD